MQFNRIKELEEELQRLLDRKCRESNAFIESFKESVHERESCLMQAVPFEEIIEELNDNQSSSK